MDVSKDFANKVLVCVIDGNPKHRADVVRALMSFYAVREFSDSVEAIEALEANPPAAIVIDEIAPPRGGLRAAGDIFKRKTLANVPLILTSGDPASTFFDEAAAFKPHACLPKPYLRSTLLNAISAGVNRGVESSWETMEPVQKSVLKQTVAMFNNISDMIDGGEALPYGDVKESCTPLVEAVTSNQFKGILSGVRGHDNYSYVHSLRVATFLSLFGHTIGIRGDTLLTLASGGLVHDVGKMSIPHDVLNKPGRLVGDEWATMQSHVARTLEFLQRNPNIPKGVMTIAAQHHEKLDGTGYPKGLKGGELNELARMASIVDVFGALTDRRVYKEPMSPEAALDIMAGMRDALDMHLLIMFREMLLDAASGLGET